MWWELVEVTRKITLTGFLLLMPQDISFYRLVVALMLSVGYLALVQAARPFRRLDNAFMAIVASLTLTSTLLVAMYIKFYDEFKVYHFDDEQNTFGSATPFSLSIWILCFNFGVIGVALLLVMQQIGEMARQPTFRLRDGQRPQMVMAPKHRWHLFISHHWCVLHDCRQRAVCALQAHVLCVARVHQCSMHARRDNQDTAALVKRQMQLLLPGVSVFLVCETIT